MRASELEIEPRKQPVTPGDGRHPPLGLIGDQLLQLAKPNQLEARFVGIFELEDHVSPDHPVEVVVVLAGEIDHDRPGAKLLQGGLGVDGSEHLQGGVVAAEHCTAGRHPSHRLEGVERCFDLVRVNRVDAVLENSLKDPTGGGRSIEEQKQFRIAFRVSLLAHLRAPSHSQWSHSRRQSPGIWTFLRLCAVNLLAMVEESRLRDTEHGLVPETDGWFVVNAQEARWFDDDGLGFYTPFEGESRFPRVGINLAVLEPGQPNCMYHREDEQENFLVISGKCLLLVEDEERELRAWDFVHCPAWTEHVFVGTGDEPCAILMIGTRTPDAGVVYPVSDLAKRHGAGVEQETESPHEAYRPYPNRKAPVGYRDGWLPER
jgi:uncharacterized cupin superfamily protein